MKGFILLMEDEMELAVMYKRKLEREGYQVSVACDGMEGLELLSKQSFDLLLVDYKMPRTNGLEVLGALKERVSPPVIMLSAVIDFEVVVKAMKLGAIDYVLKDMGEDSFPILVAALEKAMERNRLSLALEQSEQRLRDSESRFRAMIENTSDILLVLDDQDRLTYATPYFYTFSGQEDAQVLGENLAHMVHHKDLPLLCDALKIAWEHQGETLVTPDFRCFDGNGKQHHFNARLTALPQTAGVAGLVVNCRDITERKHAEKAQTKEKARAEQYLDTAGSLILALGPSGDVRLINRFACKVLGYKENDIKGSVWLERCVADAGRAAFTKLFSELFEGSNPGIAQLELKVITKKGDVRIISWSIQPMKEGRWVTHVLLSGIDVTDRKRAEAALEKSEERYSLATLAAKVGVWDWSLQSGEMYIDPQLKLALGFSNEEIANRPDAWLSKIHESERKRVWAAIERCLHDYQDFFEVEHRMVCKDGQLRWYITRASAVRDSLGKVVRLIGTDTDITDLKQAELHIEHLATHDFLTGLPNRLLLLDRLRVAIAMARRSSTSVAVLFLDLDGFKPINDLHGHDAGDDVLRQVAMRLLGTFRACDTVARFGGDEFIVTFTGLKDIQAASLMAKKVLQALALPLDVEQVDEALKISVSVGIALYPRDGETPELLVKAADEAMYHAKRAGKNQLAFARDPTEYFNAPTLGDCAKG